MPPPKNILLVNPWSYEVREIDVHLARLLRAAGGGARGEADPLLHNKLASIYLREGPSRFEFEELSRALREAGESPCL
ncbi:MAG: hypothetical protein A2W03_07545 [Candidatus Aminicenantes bacterium RBG_16_63_16]|nr:MAG: hypothetical protein A2W03_07545 [Candidatus Aminicenantes bacterium RBG_16_63_16]